MAAKRLMLVGLAVVMVVSAGCSSSKKSSVKAAASSALSSNTTMAASSSDASTATTSAAASSAAPDAAALCAAFTDLKDVSSSNTPNDLSAAQAKLKSAAQKIRSTAPAEISDSAKAYANLLDQAANEIGSAGNPADRAKALSGLGKAAANQNIIPVITWVAKNCTLG